MSRELGEAIAWYLGLMRVLGRSPRTIANYASCFRHLERTALAHGCTLVQDLQPDLVRAAVVEVLDEGRAAAAAAQRVDHQLANKGGECMASLLVTATRSLCRALAAEGDSKVPDLAQVKGPRLPERLQPRIQPDEFRALEQALDRRAAKPRYSRFVLTRDRALVHLLIETGLRASECCGLELGHVDTTSGVITVQRGKGSKPRLLSIRDPDAADGGQALRALRAYLAERSLHAGHAWPALWVGVRGRPLRPPSLEDILRQLCAEAGIDGNRPAHAFRRGWFTESFKAAPQDLPVLSARMGWSDRSQNMVRTYTRGATFDFATAPRPSLAKRWAPPREVVEVVEVLEVLEHTPPPAAPLVLVPTGKTPAPAPRLVQPDEPDDAPRLSLWDRELRENLLKICALDDQIEPLVSPEVRALMLQQSNAWGEGCMLEMDRVLAIAGLLLAQHGLGELFEQLYAATLEGCYIRPGDGRRFLRGLFLEEDVVRS